VVIAGDRDEPVIERLAAEIRTLGFEPVFRVVPAESDVPSALADAARAGDAVAALHLAPAGESVRVWLVDRVTGRTVLWEVAADPATEASNALLVLRVVELLRASLLEIRLASAPPGDVTPADEVENLVPAAPEPDEPASRLGIELGPAVLAGRFDGAPALAVHLGVSLRLHDLVGVSLLGLIPALPLEVSAEEGEARVHAGLLAAGVRLTFAEAGDRWLPCVEAGGAAGFADVRSDAEPGYDARSGWVASGGPFLRAGVAVALVPAVRLRFDLLAAWMLPATRVRFDGREVAAWGPFLLDAGLAVEVMVW
jgi:hypothetical protein